MSTPEHPTLPAGSEIVVLASGGLDSTTLAYWLTSEGYVVRPLFIDYGQHCRDTEWKSLSAVLAPELRSKIAVVDIRGVFAGSNSRLLLPTDLWRDEIESSDLLLPYRNLILIAVAAVHARIRSVGVVMAGFIDSNHALEPDCTQAFFDATAGLLGATGGVRVLMPFRKMTKADVARLGVRLGVPIGMTYSCQVSPSVPCGVCPNCVDRESALEEWL